MIDPDKTNIYSDDDKTRIYGEPGKQTKETVHHIFEGDTIALNGKNYRIHEVVSQSTGEAVIYKMTDNKDETFALKLYYKFYRPENEPNTEALQRIKNIKDDDVLRLIDFGTGINKYKGKYCFEISDFAHGFDLLHVNRIKDKYFPDFVIDQVIPQIFKGILRLHKNKIYHCDLKPQNVFYLDKEQTEIVIGDYGSAKTFGFNAAKSSRKTTVVKGTDFYLPPEQARGFISDKNDYYSFGMVLLHLLYPNEVLTNENEPKILSHSKLKRIIERQFEALPIIDFKPEYRRINHLIEGLTLVDFNLRWGKDQVQQWLDGKDLKVQYRKEKIKKTKLQTLKFGEFSISGPADLPYFILNDPDWYSNLLEDEYNRKDFMDWILDYYDGDRRKLTEFNRTLNYYSQDGKDFVGEAVIRFLHPQHPVLFGLKEFQIAESEDILKSTALSFHHLTKELWDSSTKNNLRLNLFSFEFALRHHKDKIKSEKIADLLYKRLSVDQDVGNTAKNKILAYTKIDKTSRQALIDFLTELTADEISLEFLTIETRNEVRFKLTKFSGNSQNLGTGLSFQETEVQTIILPEIKPLGSFDEFIEKSFNYFLDELIAKQNILLELNRASIIQVKTEFRKAFEQTMDKIQSEMSLIQHTHLQEIKEITGLHADLSKFEAFMKAPDYNQLGEIHTSFLTLKDQLLKIGQTQGLLIELKKGINDKSPALPILNLAEKLLATKNFGDIANAYQLLTKKHKFTVQTFLDIREIEQHLTLSYNRLGSCTRAETSLNGDVGILGLTVSNDGKYVVASSNISVTAYNTINKSFEFTHQNITSDLNRTALSPDNTYFAYTDIYHEHTVLHDFFSGKKVDVLKKKKSISYGLSFSPDGKYLAVSGNETIFWDVEKRKAEKTFTASVEISFKQDNTLFLSMGKGKILLTDYTTWKSTLIEEFPTKGNIGISLSPGGNYIAVGNTNGTIRIIDPKTKQVLHSLSTDFPDDGKPYFCFSPDETLLAINTNLGHIDFWCPKTGKKIFTVNGFRPNEINGLLFHPGGEHIVLAYANSLVFIKLKNSFVRGAADLTISKLLSIENMSVTGLDKDKEFNQLKLLTVAEGKISSDSTNSGDETSNDSSYFELTIDSSNGPMEIDLSSLDDLGSLIKQIKKNKE